MRAIAAIAASPAARVLRTHPGAAPVGHHRFGGQGINFNGNDFLVLARMTPEQARRARRRENTLVDALRP